MDELMRTVAKTAEKLGVKGAELWPRIVLYHWVMNVVWAILVPVVMAVLLVVFTRALRWAGEEGYAAEKDPFPALLVVGTGIVLLGLSIVGVVSYPRIIASVFSPEAGLAYSILKGTL